MSDPPRPRRRVIDGSLLFMIAFAAVSAVACYGLKGPDVFTEALRHEGALLLYVAPVIAGAVLLAAFLQVLVPMDLVKRQLGHGSGWRGLALATGIGAFVPGGPMASFPLMLAVIGAGADIAASAAFLTSWSIIALQRIIVWEIPLMGGDFALIRFLASLPLSILCGWITAWLLRRHPLYTPDRRDRRAHRVAVSSPARKRRRRSRDLRRHARCRT